MSTQQVRVQTGLLTGQVTLAGATRVFYKNTLQSGDTDTGDGTAADKPEPGSFRSVKNTSAANAMYLGKAANVLTTTGYKLDPGESFVVAGPSGAGWTGDLFVIGTDGDVIAKMAF